MAGRPRSLRIGKRHPATRDAAHRCHPPRPTPLALGVIATPRVVATISPEDVRKARAKSKSGLLATALKNRELLIAETVQTFPFALDEIRADSSLTGRRLALIADEAHSSQSSQIFSELEAVLTEEEVKEVEEGRVPPLLDAACDRGGLHP